MKANTPIRRGIRHRLAYSFAGLGGKKVVLIVALVWALTPSIGYASEVPPASVAPQVFLVPPKCGDDTSSLATFLDSLRVELAGSNLRCCTLVDAIPTASESRFVQVRIDEVGSCGVDAEQIKIAVRQSDSPRMLEREISLTDVSQSARPRALALAVAELIRSLAEEPRDTPAKPLPRVQQRRRPESTRVEPTHVQAVDYAVQGEGEVRAFPMRQTTLFGCRARLTAHRSSIQASADVGADFSNVPTALGELRLRSASIGLGLGPRLASTVVALSLGPRVEIGWAWIRGATSMTNVGTNSGSGPIASIGFRTALEVRVHRTVLPCVGVEIGGMMQGMHGNVDNKTTAGLGGYYFLAALGVAMRL